VAKLLVVQGREAFSALARQGRRVREGPVTVVHLPLEHDPRVAFAVGRAVGPAAVRNRVRRRLRALWREILDTTPPPAGDYLVMTAPPAAALGLVELRRHLAAALHRLGTAP
jgi:ribonuclease P protein component